MFVMVALQKKRKMVKSDFLFMKLKKYLYETIKYALRCYPIIYPYIRKIERMYNMSNDELTQRNEKRFQAIFRYAYDNSPFYRKLYIEAGIKKEDIVGIQDLKKLPVITKKMVKENAEKILTVPHWQVIEANTSGTTGSPLKIYESWPSIWWSQAYTYCARKKCGFTYGQRLVSLRGHLDSRLTHLRVHISNTLFLSSYRINQQSLHFYYDKIVRFHPVAIEGYPSSLYSLALLLREAGLKLHVPVAFTSSETLFDHQRHLIEEQLGTEVYDLYGMTEQTISLMEAKDHEGYYESPGYSINEYLEDGEICTSLINRSFPMIRYRSNDIIELNEVSAPCSQAVVKRIEGRKEDFIYCKDGTRIMRLDFLFKRVQHVKVSQLIQNKDGSLHICIVPEVGFNENDKEQIGTNLENRIGRGNIDYCIKLISENEIRYTSRGKFKYIINRMKLLNTDGV